MKLSLTTIISVFIVIAVLITGTTLYAQSELAGYDSRLDLNENNEIDREDMHLAVDYYLDNIGETSGRATPTSTATPTEPTATSTQEVEPTLTSTPTQEVTNTPEPTATNTPEPVGNVEPYQSASLCDVHDNESWHGLWNYSEGCHYNHTHNANPQDTVFADYVDDWNISYAWQTPHENQDKHSGYKYSYTVNPNCDNTLGGDCVKYALIQLHATGSSLGLTTRFHSFRAILEVCDSTGNNCGIVQTGGWSDFGILHCPYKDTHCPLDSDPENVNFEEMKDHPPYRAGDPIEKIDTSRGRVGQIWNTGAQAIVREWYPTDSKYNQILEYDFITTDAWGGLNTDNLEEVHLICPEGNCEWNHSSLYVYEIVVRLPQTGTYSTFTDLRGRVDESCTEEGPNCVPLIVENVSTVSGSFRVPITSDLLKDPGPAYEHDIYFCDGTYCDYRNNNAEVSGWIQYPN